MGKLREKYAKIAIAKPNIGPIEKKYVNEALNSGWVSSAGPMVSQFEKVFSDFIGARYGVAVANGTVALDLALLALGIGPGDEVIVPSFTFAASVNAIIHAGAKPVFVDSSFYDWNVDPQKIEDVINNKTRAIIVVHVYGIPARMGEILKIAKRRKLFVIEDAAEAHGALYGDRKTGSLGDVGCFSFFGNKIMTTGEGGMCVTNNKNLYDKMKIIYSHGSKPHKLIYYFHPVVGYNFRMTNIQAALGLAQLYRLQSFLKKRALHEKWYRFFLNGVSGIKFSPKPAGTTAVDWMHSILIDNRRTSRDKLMIELKKRNIETRPFFYPIHKMPPYIKYSQGDFPVANYLAKSGINLPSSTLLSKKDIFRVAASVKEIINNGK